MENISFKYLFFFFSHQQSHTFSIDETFISTNTLSMNFYERKRGVCRQTNYQVEKYIDTGFSLFLFYFDYELHGMQGIQILLKLGWQTGRKKASIKEVIE